MYTNMNKTYLYRYINIIEKVKRQSNHNFITKIDIYIYSKKRREGEKKRKKEVHHPSERVFFFCFFAFCSFSFYYTQ